MNTRPTVISSALHNALADLGAKLERGEKLGLELDRALDLLRDLSPAQISRADTAIAEAANLHHYQKPQPLLNGLLFSRPSHHAQLLRTPRLEYLFIFHRDGRLREAALLKVTGGLPTPFLFAAVAWRLNDWAAPVREAALRCARRSFPATGPDVVARCATALLVRRLSWRRWRDERTALDEAFGRADVAEHLANLLIEGTTGPLASVLRSALRNPALDRHLARVASEALQPSIRAVALDALINGRAEWPSGYDWQWTDKSMGLRRRAIVHDHRALAVAVSRDLLIASGIGDRSAAVRRVALSGIIRHALGSPKAREYAELLLSDRSPSVRERAEFILRTEVTRQPEAD